VPPTQARCLKSHRCDGLGHLQFIHLAEPRSPKWLSTAAEGRRTVVYEPTGFHEAPRSVMSTFLKRHAQIPKYATPSRYRFSDAARSWFRGLTVVVALLVAATACGETTSSDPAEEVSAVVEVPDQCPDGLRAIEDPEATKDLRCADLTDAGLTGAESSGPIRRVRTGPTATPTGATHALSKRRSSRSHLFSAQHS
jgi:hypothetical protein